ncbi:MAG: hypothetical protein LRY55_00970 [Leadbetterella sp.]|nr:hypothetical protein [Leadbetterella sp.]
MVLLLGALAFRSALNDVGYFEAEGKKHNTKFVRVLYAGEGSEEEGKGDSVQQLLFDSKDPKGNAVKAYRFQVVAKNTGYDELQTTQDKDYKLKSVENGVKLHIEVPVENGKLVLDKAYVGNLAYNFGTRETRHILTAENVSGIDLDLQRLELPVFGKGHKPGDKGIIYNSGYIRLMLTSKAKHIASDKVSDFNAVIDGPVSITHIRGKERADRAVTIDEGIVKKNI